MRAKKNSKEKIMTELGVQRGLDFTVRIRMKNYPNKREQRVQRHRAERTRTAQRISGVSRQLDHKLYTQRTEEAREISGSSQSLNSNNKIFPCYLFFKHLFEYDINIRVRNLQCQVKSPAPFSPRILEDHESSK